MEWVVFYRVAQDSAWLVEVGLSEERARRLAGASGWRAAFAATVDEIVDAVAKNPRITADDETGGTWAALYQQARNGESWRLSMWWPSRGVFVAMVPSLAEKGLECHVCSVGRLAEHLLKGREA